jgi:pimeloyl-ACP methyl ester carboxylesterase
MLWSDPVAYQQLAIALTVGVKQVSMRSGARLLFSSSEVTPLIEQFFKRCDDESPWLAMDLQGFPRIGPVRYDRGCEPPVMVVSGETDRLIRLQDAEATADFYQTPLQSIAGGSHMLMFDAEAPNTARVICAGFAQMAATV